MASAYGQEHLITPFFDELTSKALTFHSAVTNFAYCAPSRNSCAQRFNLDSELKWTLVSRHTLMSSDGIHVALDPCITLSSQS